ncbi:MAG: hypothetical protein AB7F74_08975 [Parvibaculaceae bacterium]
MTKKERPEALAQFAESARKGEREGVKGVAATKATEPIPTDPKAKDDAATRILAEGATGKDMDAEEAVEELPDRILESQKKSEGRGRSS